MSSSCVVYVCVCPHELQEQGLRPLAGCYGSAMNALGKAGRLDEVLALLE